MVEASLSGAGERLQPDAHDSVAAGVIPVGGTNKQQEVSFGTSCLFF